jgi:hypothetical protein
MQFEDVARTRRSVITVGRALPGMQDVSRNASSNFAATAATEALLERLCNVGAGAVVLEIMDEQVVGTDVKLKGSGWQQHLDELKGRVDESTPCVFVMARGSAGVLLVKYIPDNAKTKARMLYASSMSSLKDLIQKTFGDDVPIEEFNASHREELNFKAYDAHKNIEAPLTEAERARIETDKEETAGGYSLIARLAAMSGGPPVRLPGMGAAAVPKALSKPAEPEPDEGEAPSTRRESTQRRESKSRQSASRSPARKSVEREPEPVAEQDDEDEAHEEHDHDHDKKGHDHDHDKKGGKAREQAHEQEHEHNKPKASSAKTESKPAPAKQAASQPAKAAQPEPAKNAAAAKSTQPDKQQPAEDKKKPGTPPTKVETKPAAAPAPAPKKETSPPAKAPAAAGKPKEPEPAQEEGFTLSELMAMKKENKFAPGVEKANLESSLRPSEFKKLLGMDRAEFDKQPAWKKVNLKKTAKLH